MDREIVLTRIPELRNTTNVRCTVQIARGRVVFLVLLKEGHPFRHGLGNKRKSICSSTTSQTQLPSALYPVPETAAICKKRKSKRERRLSETRSIERRRNTWFKEYFGSSLQERQERMLPR